VCLPEPAHNTYRYYDASLAAHCLHAKSSRLHNLQEREQFTKHKALCVLKSPLVSGPSSRSAFPNLLTRGQLVINEMQARITAEAGGGTPSHIPAPALNGMLRLQKGILKVALLGR
jgi:hypothetical protein